MGGHTSHLNRRKKNPLAHTEIYTSITRNIHRYIFILRLYICVYINTMASTKMAFVLLLHLVVGLICTATPVPWIHIPDTAPYGHPVIKLPCRPHLTTNYTITQYLLEISQVQAHDSDKSSAHISGPKLQEQLLKTHLFSLDKDDCLVVTYADFSHWRGRDIAVTVRTFENHSTVDHNFLVRVLSQPSSIELAFQEPEYLGYILENQRRGSFVHGLHNLRVTAHSSSSSSSSSLSPGDINYYILGPTSARQAFSLTTLPDGEVQIFTKQALDREVTSTHAFVVEAVGPMGSFATAKVCVDVLDVDDTAPILKKKYVTIVDEKTPVETSILKVVARDPDLSMSPPVYTMEPHVQNKETSHDDTPFRIDPSTGIVTSTMSPLPENHRYQFKVFASDSSGHQSASSLVEVIVKKNVALKFENSENQQQSPLPSLYVGHDDPSYSSVVQVRRRRALNSKVTKLKETQKGNLLTISIGDPQAKYELISDPSGWFKVDPVSGNVTLQDGQSMDYETVTSVELMFRITTSAGKCFLEIENSAIDNILVYISAPNKIHFHFPLFFLFKEKEGFVSNVSQLKLLTCDLKFCFYLF